MRKIELTDDYMAEMTTPEPNTGCLLWLGRLTHDGYGQIGGRGYVHVELFKRNGGVVPEGYEVDHLCRVRSCVNPAHLEAVTRAENIRRGWEFRRSARGINPPCPHGGRRGQCLPCLAEYARERRKKKNALKPPAPPRSTCSNGHAWNEANIGRTATTGHVYCRVCNRDWQRQRRAGLVAPV